MDPTGYAAPALAGAGLAGRFAEAEEVQLTPEQLRQPRTLGYVQ